VSRCMKKKKSCWGMSEKQHCLNKHPQSRRIFLFASQKKEWKKAQTTAVCIRDNNCCTNTFSNASLLLIYIQHRGSKARVWWWCDFSQARILRDIYDALPTARVRCLLIITVLTKNVQIHNSIVVMLGDNREKILMRDTWCMKFGIGGWSCGDFWD